MELRCLFRGQADGAEEIDILVALVGGLPMPSQIRILTNYSIAQLGVPDKIEEKSCKKNPPSFLGCGDR